MGNQLFDNTYLIDTVAGTALSWPTAPQIAQVRVLALDTTASLTFVVAANTPVFRFAMITQGQVSAVSANATSIAPSLYTFPMGKVRFGTAWIPTTLVACTAWIDFA